MHVLIPITGLPVLALALAQLTKAQAASLACLVIVVFGGAAAADFSRMCYRLRWIWLSLCLIYAVFTPGEYMFSQWLGVSVTYEGLLGAASQLLSLFAMLAWVSFLLHRYPAMTIVSGLYQSLAAFGVPARWLTPMIVRLYLILQQTHPLSAPTRDWIALLHTPEQLMQSPTQHRFTLVLQPLRRIDWACLVGMCVLLVLCMLGR